MHHSKKIVAVKNLPAQYTRSAAGMKLGIRKVEKEFIAAGGNVYLERSVSITLLGSDFADDRVSFVMEQII